MSSSYCSDWTSVWWNFFACVLRGRLTGAADSTACPVLHSDSWIFDNITWRTVSVRPGWKWKWILMEVSRLRSGRLSGKKNYPTTSWHKPLSARNEHRLDQEDNHNRPTLATSSQAPRTHASAICRPSACWRSPPSRPAWSAHVCTSPDPKQRKLHPVGHGLVQDLPDRLKTSRTVHVFDLQNGHNFFCTSFHLSRDQECDFRIGESKKLLCEVQ